MTIKTLIFLLFLYVCLAWVGAALLHPDDIQHFGLLWTAIGLIVVVVFILGVRLFGWWRSWRAKASTRRAAAPSPAPIAHEDDIALAALLAEANLNLKKAPAYATKRGAKPLSGMPLYLLIGPEGSGKTSTFVNSGLEPQLLAGQLAGTGPPLPTRLCNLWLAKDAIFAELSGRAFSGDLIRWTEMLKVLQGRSSLPTWRRLFRDPDQGFTLQGVVAFSDAKEFTGAPNFQTLERRSRDLRERLLAVGDVFGVAFPVYQVFTKSDAIPFFPDFFRRLPEQEANQVLGCTLPLNGAPMGEFSAEDQAKRLAKAFRQLYQELAKRRVTHLAHEPEPARRPAIYEFPRELKRVRTPMIQFLNDTFRPHPLRYGPLLRGYYLSGIREVEMASANPDESRVDWPGQKEGMETTRMFSAADATRMFRVGDPTGGTKPGARGPLVPRWIFTLDLFQSVVLADRPIPKAPSVDLRVELYRRGIFAAAGGLSLLLCFAFLWSWGSNRALVREISGVVDAGSDKGARSMLRELTALDALRVQLERLLEWRRSSPPLGFRWGLYTGNRVLEDARQAYFWRFKNLLLSQLNGDMVAHLQSVPAAPTGNEPYEPIYNLLKTHLMLADSCKPDSAFVDQVLRQTRKEAGLAAASSDEQALADKQIAFYAKELPQGVPFPVAENAEARDHARLYLQNIKGIDRIYKNLLADAVKKVPKPQRLGDLASNYTRVLKGPAEPSGAFTRAGWDFMEKASKAGNAAALGEPCVVGNTLGAVANWKQDTEIARKLQRRFIAEYIASWRSFVQGYSVVRYSSPEDAATKLEILADHKSPLLALFFLVGTETSFPATAAEQNAMEKGLEKMPLLKKVVSGMKKAEQAAQASATETTSPADITQIFQPVLWVVPPTSDTWVGDKNNGYMEALSQLGHSMENIGRNSLDPAIRQEASVNYAKAMQAAQQLGRGFKPIGVDGLDSVVQTLLEQPIVYTKPFVEADVPKVEADKVNGALRTFCATLNGTLRKYPFRASQDAVSLNELAKSFAPGGVVWKFQTQTLGEVTVKADGSQWKPKDPAKKPQVTQQMLSFLNGAQTIADVFFPGGATQPHLTYTLRPKLDSSLKEWTLTLTIDGQVKEWTQSSSLQKQFTWPGPADAKDQGASGRIQVGTFSTAFASRGGLWGIFRIMGDAEPRTLLQKEVEWKFLRSGEGRPEPLQPPVRLEIVEFPSGADVFNPKFFEDLQCPSKAVQ